MAEFRAKKNTSNVHKTSPTRGERGAEGLTRPAQLKANAKGGFSGSFNQGKNTKSFNT